MVRETWRGGRVSSLQWEALERICTLQGMIQERRGDGLREGTESLGREGGRGLSTWREAGTCIDVETLFSPQDTIFAAV